MEKCPPRTATNEGMGTVFMLSEVNGDGSDGDTAMVTTMVTVLVVWAWKMTTNTLAQIGWFSVG